MGSMYASIPQEGAPPPTELLLWHLLRGTVHPPAGKSLAAGGVDLPWQPPATQCSNIVDSSHLQLVGECTKSHCPFCFLMCMVLEHSHHGIHTIASGGCTPSLPRHFETLVLLRRGVSQPRLESSNCCSCGGGASGAHF